MVSASRAEFGHSIFDAAAKFASAIGVPVLGLLLLRIGWRWSFAVTGAISVAYLVAYGLMYREPEQDAHLSTAMWDYIKHDSPAVERPGEKRVDASDSLCYLLTQRKVLALALGMGSYNYVFYLLLTWLPQLPFFGLAHRPFALVPVHRRSLAGGHGD